MGKFIIFILLLWMLWYLLKQFGADKATGGPGTVTMACTDLLGLLLQLTKVSTQLEVLRLTASTESARQKVQQSQQLVDAERLQLMARLRQAGVSELAIQQAASVE